MVFYGLGKNFQTLVSFGLLPEDDRFLLVDGFKHGSDCCGKEIMSPEVLKNRTSEDVYVVPAKSDDIVKKLVDEIGVDPEHIKTAGYINKAIVLGGLDRYRYVMLTTDADYLNYPYFPLQSRDDFTMRPVIEQLSPIDPDIDDVDTSNIVFIVRDHCFLRLIEYGIIDYLKKKYVNAAWVTVMSDMCGGEFGRIRLFGDDYIDRLKSSFDLVMTYHFADSQKYGLTYYEQAYPAVEMHGREIYDVLFVGNAKNRLELLHGTFLKLKENGATCRFYINGVDEESQIEDADVIYNRLIPYDTYLDEVSKCRCILEIIQTGDESTYRYAEAVVYNKKLLVNDPSCVRRKHFDKGFMRCFRSIDDIDTEWIKNDITVDYKYSGEFLPERFLEFIDNRLEKTKRR